MSGYYTIFQSDKSSDYYFNLHAGNHQVILSSQGYDQKAGAQNGIASVQANGGDESRFELETAKDGSFFFRLKAANGQVIGRSEMYTTKEAAQNGIQSVMTNAASIEIKEK